MLVFEKRALLTSIGFKFIAQNSHGHTRLAAIAIGTVGKKPTSAKATFYQIGVNIILNQMTGRGHLRSCLAHFQVTAGVSRSGIKLQCAKGQIFEMRHALSGVIFDVVLL